MSLGTSAPPRSLLGGSAPIALIVLLAVPGTIGTTPSGIRTIVAPFHGVSIATDGSFVKGCGKATIAGPATFHFPTGKGGFSDSASAHSCANSTTSEGFADAVLITYIRIPYHPGSAVIFENATFGMSSNTSLTPGACTVVGTPATASCDQYAYAEVYGYSLLIDNTTGNTTTPSGYSGWTGFYDYLENYTSCTRNSCSSGFVGGGGARTFYQNASWTFVAGTMKKSDNYTLMIYLYGGAGVRLTTHNMLLTGARGHGSMRFEKLWRGVRLNSIVES